MAGSSTIFSTHLWKLLAGRKLVALTFLVLCVLLMILYWTTSRFGYNLHHAQTSNFFPRLESLDQHMSGNRTGILREENLLQSVNNLPFRAMTASSLLLEDLYFIPSMLQHNHFDNRILHEPSTGCSLSDVFLLILVPSPPDTGHVRKAIRETWGSLAHGTQWPWREGRYSVRLVFVLGVMQNAQFQMGSGGAHTNNTLTFDRVKAQVDSQPHRLMQEDDMAAAHGTQSKVHSSLDTTQQTPEINDHAGHTDHGKRSVRSQSRARSVQSRDDFGFEFVSMVQNTETEEEHIKRNLAQSLLPGNLTKMKEIWSHGSSMSTWSDRGKVTKATRSGKAKVMTTSRSNRSKAKLDVELSSFQDILQFDLLDSYVNLTQKIVLALQWAITSCPKVKYILKADQDVFVNLPLLMTFLKHYGERNSIYGHIYANAWVQRQGKWAVSNKSLPIARYPIYAAGNAYVLSKDSAVKVVKLAPYFPYIPIEDAYVTGILASVAKVDRVNMAGFTKWTEDRADICQFVHDKRYVGNNMTAFDHRTVWRALIDRGNGLCDR